MNHGKRIRDLLDNGDRSHNRSDVDAAIRAYQEACGLAEAAVERDPEDADAHELLARIHLTLGDWQTQRNDLQAAVKTLKAAESTWEKAGALRYAQTHEGLLRIVPDTGISGLPGADGGPEFERAIADVAIARAQAHAGLGNLFSALADAQQALFTYIVQAEAGHLASDFDQALIAVAAAEVQMRAGGDPEIIAAPPDTRCTSTRRGSSHWSHGNATRRGWNIGTTSRWRPKSRTSPISRSASMIEPRPYAN
ncbi:tetratricopeptide repeat protein [Micromonospora sp. Llam0]|uniref:tetratricopeptide repeat protein n=1 Tax=Micromonospora sp. Llam0 TaxID=2485143 RepID=UPI000F9D7B12|nr:tetratricopeptide repeat protein [Micromonospora sp. Llam0]ROO59341.1 tetratricopeptide repeat protein [Micromonospora sp. Llam0]